MSSAKRERCSECGQQKPLPYRADVGIPFAGGIIETEYIFCEECAPVVVERMVQQYRDELHAALGWEVPRVARV